MVSPLFIVFSFCPPERLTRSVGRDSQFSVTPFSFHDIGCPLFMNFVYSVNNFSLLVKTKMNFNRHLNHSKKKEKTGEKIYDENSPSDRKRISLWFSGAFYSLVLLLPTNLQNRQIRVNTILTNIPFKFPSVAVFFLSVAF